MKKFSTFAVLAGAVLALPACGPDKAAEETAAPEAAAPAEPMAEEVDEAAAAAEGLDPTGNPIGPDAPVEAE